MSPGYRRRILGPELNQFFFRAFYAHATVGIFTIDYHTSKKDFESDYETHKNEPGITAQD